MKHTCPLAPRHFCFGWKRWFWWHLVPLFLLNMVHHVTAAAVTRIATCHRFNIIWTMGHFHSDIIGSRSNVTLFTRWDCWNDQTCKFCYLFSVVPKWSSETSLKASSSIDSSLLMSGQFSIIQSRNVPQLKPERWVGAGGDTEGCGFKLLQHFKDKLFPSECVLMILDAEVAVFFFWVISVTRPQHMT